ncbi:hypothetical protein CC78DRAFT_382138 [Lojkania enalia]|uniref:Uncharacterized protein n=1 Tax=Lojkania enalia TaxID=147567 RepID=A0A9P4N0V2_9PLEO|nr:hypothetical protein CC78DRAFT_382138 [Didymosphaeria enalia]
MLPLRPSWLPPPKQAADQLYLRPNIGRTQDHIFYIRCGQLHTDDHHYCLQCTNSCVHYQSDAYPREICDHLYCSLEWRKRHWGYVPNYVQMRPTEVQRQILSRLRDHEIFKNFPQDIQYALDPEAGLNSSRKRAMVEDTPPA